MKLTCFIIILELLFNCVFTLRISSDLPKLNSNVYSLATRNQDGSTNMNIVTYATPVSIKPTQIWAISLYLNSLSYDNFLREGWGVLQQLNENHAEIIDLLGNNSGYMIDKMGELKGKGIILENIDFTLYTQPSNKLSLDIISDADFCLHLSQGENDSLNVGDHDVIFCDVIKYLESENKIHSRLTTKFLRENGLL